MNQNVSFNEIHDSIQNATDPIQKARWWIRSLENEINVFAVKARNIVGREMRARKAMEKKKETIVHWEQRLQVAKTMDKASDMRLAEDRIRGLADESREVEKSWWEISQEREQLERLQHQMENLVQEVRREKENLISCQRRGKSSSDFIPIRVDTTSLNVDAEAIEGELKALKEKKISEEQG